ncbi:MAG: HAD family hydrolase [Candidatus Rokuibacteriota bacterium]
MRARAYRAVLFDLFDTLVRFDRERLPAVPVNGRVVHSTVGQLHPILAAWAPEVTLEALYGALLESWQEAERRRAIDHREVAAAERFACLLRSLSLDPAACPREILQQLLEAHRQGLSRAAEFPASHGPLLTELARRYRLAVVSNFDYTPTAVGILEATGVAGLFEAVVVSDAVGWRKPAPAIFEVALARLRVPAAEALFVGDRADIDVLGAQRIGMHAAWLNRDGGGLPSGVAPPEFEIRDLGELRGILGGPGRI